MRLNYSRSYSDNQDSAARNSSCCYSTMGSIVAEGYNHHWNDGYIVKRHIAMPCCDSD